MSTSEIIDQLIKAIRAAEDRNHVTRYKLAKDAGIQQSTISRLMSRDRKSLKIETVEALARQLGFVLELKPEKKGRKR